MLRLRFFASIREHLGRPTLELPFTERCASVDGLIAHLDAGALPGCAEWLRAPSTLVAINRVVTDRGAAVADGDEIAFYPPVTGG
jgi:molybdopterin synthase sulfur carrier subunit